MGQMLIRKLDDKVIKKIKARAKANGRSAEAEVRDLLTETVMTSETQQRKSLVDLIGSAGRLFENQKEIDDWVRQLRDEWDR
jgi:plasmid stability protein